MKWFNNIKIGGKMIVGFGAVIVLAIFLAAYAWVQLGVVSNNYQYLLDQSIVRRQAAMEAQSNIRAIRRTLTATVMHAPAGNTAAINSLHDEMRVFHAATLAALEDYDATIRRNPTFSQAERNSRFALSANVRNLTNQYIEQIFIPANRYALQGDHASALAVVTGGAHIVEDIIAATNYLVNMTNDAIARNSVNIVEETQAYRNLLILISFVVILVAIVLALLIARAIAKPVQDLVALTGKVSDGQLNINMDQSKVTNDEIGKLTGYVYGLINTMKGIVDDIDKFAHEANTNGDIEYRINASKYRGGYADMINSLNGFTDGFVEDVLSILNVLKQVGEGDFNFNLKQLPGKKAVLNQSVDGLKNNLDSVSAEINAMIDAAAVKGDLDIKIDASKYAGGWGEIMKGLNQIAAAVESPISEINTVMDNLSRGDFSKKVNGNYAGDFLQIKNAVNTTIDALSAYIEEIGQVLNKISSGDLRVSVTRDYVGSFGAIKDSLNNISMTLNKTMSDISSATEQVFIGASQISESAISLASGAQEQASSVEELNATIEVIDKQTGNNASNALNANELSEKSASNAQQGNEAMKQMVDAMTQIKESSGNISKIVKTIQEIAFQTNLLALNASVEAARAGEHGKGFAVVADEVRSLAGRSQQAATETTELIQDSIRRVESGSVIAESTAQSLDDIVSGASGVLEIIGNISKASVEQAESISSINDGLTQISKVVQNNSAVSEETAAASQELSAQAETLRELVSYFKL